MSASEPQAGMPGTIAQARAEFDRGVSHYVRAIHLSRIAIAAVTVMVALVTVDEIPVGHPFAIGAPIVGLVWMIVVAACWDEIRRQLVIRPWIIWMDPLVLLGLMVVNKPWDSLIVLPYCSFVLLVPFVRPRAMAVLVVVTAIATYLPKILLTLVGWRYAHLVPPVTTTDWPTVYVGPAFCGTVSWALCSLHAGVQSELTARESAERSLMDARAQASRLVARQRLANRLHETLSQVVRAIPLFLDGEAPKGITSAATVVRRQIIELALDTRPAVQSVARELKEVAEDGTGMTETTAAHSAQPGVS